MAYSSSNLNRAREFHIDEGLQPSIGNGKPVLLGTGEMIVSVPYTLRWSRGGVTASDYAIRVGRTVGGADIANLGVGNVDNHELDDLPYYCCCSA